MLSILYLSKNGSLFLNLNECFLEFEKREEG